MVRDRIVHQLARQVELAHRPARPTDDLGREHVVDAQLGHDPGHEGVDADAVGVGELREVPQPHEDRRLGVTAACLAVAFDGRREAEAEWVKDRVEDVRDPGRLDRGAIALERVEPLAEVGDQDHRAVQLRQQVEVLGVDAEEHVDAGGVGGADGRRVERVDADRKTALLEAGDHLPDAGEALHRRRAEVDDVGAAAAVVLGSGEDVREAHPPGIDDLGEDPRPVLAVPFTDGLVAEVSRQVLEILRAAHDGHSHPPFQSLKVAAAQPGDHHAATSTRVGQTAGDPLRAHEGGDGAVEHRQLVAALEVEAVERRPQRRLGEPPRHEQVVGHPVVPPSAQATSHSSSAVWRRANASPVSSERISAKVP